MTTEHLILLSVPGLRLSDVDPAATPTLYAWANAGALASLTPTFPCVTSPVQASMLTGVPPRQHGVTANGFYDRAQREVAFWVARNDVLQATSIWSTLRARRPHSKSAVWHAQNIKDAAADWIVTPAPIHKSDGSMELWCYSKPDDLYADLLEEFGHFPLMNYWGPLANIESTRWILRAAAWLAETRAPNLHYVYVPHLDYAGQKYGPNAPQSRAALAELDRELADFAQRIAHTEIRKDVVFLVVGEYAMTDVTGPVLPNRVLRQAGLAKVREEAGAELIDLRASDAFAMVDHQFAHVYVNHAGAAAAPYAAKAAELFAHEPGVAALYAGEDRAAIGMDHPRAGDLVLVADDAHWFAYYWWMEDAAAPAFAHTVDIHRKPGYDPVELFLGPDRRIPLDATLVRGSHGVPATEARHRTAMICSRATEAVRTGRPYRDTDVHDIALKLLGAW